MPKSPVVTVEGKEAAQPSKAQGIRWVPAACDVSVTNVCNATCDFCCFARDKQLVKEKRWLSREDFARALPILYRRGIRYLTFQGGEPLLHREIAGLVADTSAVGIHAGVITNGWTLPQKIESLVRAGLQTLLVSIDSHSLEEHERNRGLQGVGERIRHGLSVAGRNRVMRLASVTVSRLVRYEALPELLNDLGFDAVVFSYPRREPFGSTSMVYNQDSLLINFDTEELCEALESIKALRKKFPVFNPAASIDDIKRHVRGEREHFACIGGHKYFYIDWNLNIWRCEAWGKPYGSVFDLDKIPDCRERCTACMMACYRDASVLMHAGVALEDAMTAMGAGRLGEGTRLLFQWSVAQSLGAVAAQSREVFRLAGRPLKRWASDHVPDFQANTI